MKLDRAARRCALQAMYQFDADPGADVEIVRSTLEGSGADETTQKAGFALATMAWEFRDESDAEIDRVSLDWPVRRQPMVDRNVLRLAHHEIRRAGTPPKVAINEAVELAREFGAEKSPGFVNAILDRLVKGDAAETETSA
ncbi:MAG: transcription antitermination factor NusB [Planctomycetota bacterium]